jgi:transglutaminase-like putative cysteine protease
LSVTGVEKQQISGMVASNEVQGDKCLAFGPNRHPDLCEMLLKFTHETDLAYSSSITESVMELRVAPRQEQDQHRLSFTLAIGPATSVTGYFDWMGNSVHAFAVNPPHKLLRITATSVIETDRVTVDPNSLHDSWPGPAPDWRMHDWLHFGGPVIDSPLLRQLVDVLNPCKGEPLGALAMRILRLINERFLYQKGITTAASPITDVLQHGRGVCQDFTHLMIGIGRAIGVPARYVSGLLHPDAQKFRGYTQTHAWCELLFPSQGWIGFDAANNCVIGPNFAKVAVGRDFRDVPPNKGVYRGTAIETIDVRVHSEELGGIPSELAAERMASLPVPIDAAGISIHREAAPMQQEQQQQ